MKLITVSQEVLVNVDSIDVVTRRMVKGKEILTVYVKGLRYEVTIPILEFLESVRASEEHKQMWVG